MVACTSAVALGCGEGGTGERGRGAAGLADRTIFGTTISHCTVGPSRFAVAGTISVSFGRVSAVVGGTTIGATGIVAGAASEGTKMDVQVTVKRKFRGRSAGSEFRTPAVGCGSMNLVSESNM